jgi:hypothetical protein
MTEKEKIINKWQKLVNKDPKHTLAYVLSCLAEIKEIKGSK